MGTATSTISILDGELDLGSLEPQKIQRTIGGKTYIIREPDEATVIRWRRATMQGTTMHEGKFSGLDGAADAEPILVAGCLFSVDDQGAERPVVLETVKKWVGRVVVKLHDLIHEMCPYLKGEETEDSLSKEIAKLEKRLAAVRSEKGNTVPNLPDGSADTSN